MDTGSVDPAAASSAATEWIRSPDFCFEDGTIWLRVENVLYCVPSGLLQLRSSVFKSILSLKGTDGDSARNPVYLESISSTEFNHLARYLFIGWEEPPYETAMLVSLLKLATLYDMESVRSFAIYNIQHNYDISPSMKINLARKFTVPQWIEPAFKTLLVIGAPNISLADAHHLGLKTYHILVNTHAETVGDRMRLSLVAPPVVHGDQCASLRSCEVAWKELWLSKVTRWLVNPDYPPRIADILDHIKTLLPVPLMGVQCQQETLVKLEGMTVLRKQKFSEELALKQVLDYHKSLEC